jgi:preprotein translocase subunit SecY
MGGFQNIGKIPELKRRILATLLLLAVYRVGVHIPTPGIDGRVLASIFEQAKGTLLGFFDMFAGGGLERLSVFALGIMPYISASIILQLLTVVVPTLERLSKEGVYTVWHGSYQPYPGFWYCSRFGTDARCSRGTCCL